MEHETAARTVKLLLARTDLSRADRKLLRQCADADDAWKRLTHEQMDLIAGILARLRGA